VENEGGDKLEPVSLDLARSKSFLRQLKRHPFVAIIVKEDAITVYRRADMTDEDMDEVLSMLAETIKDV
jgi:hypothetical protein